MFEESSRTGTNNNNINVSSLPFFDGTTQQTSNPPTSKDYYSISSSSINMEDPISSQRSSVPKLSYDGGNNELSSSFLMNTASDVVMNYGINRFYNQGDEMLKSIGIGAYLMSFLNGMKPYFSDVSNRYVIMKLLFLMFPYYDFGQLQQQQQQQRFSHNVNGALPLEMVMTSSNNNNNSRSSLHRNISSTTDLYIPLMSYITYILLVTFLSGARNEFTPDLLASIASKGAVTLALEVLVIKLGFYFLSSPTSMSILEIASYTGNKYVPIVMSIGISLFLNYWSSILMVRTIDAAASSTTTTATTIAAVTAADTTASTTTSVVTPSINVGMSSGIRILFYMICLFLSISMSVFLVKSLRKALTQTQPPTTTLAINLDLDQQPSYLQDQQQKNANLELLRSQRAYFVLFIALLQIPMIAWFVIPYS